MDIPYKMPKKERKCVICGDTLLGNRRVLCSKRECKLERIKQLKKQRKPQQKEVWVLNEENWTWSLKK